MFTLTIGPSEELTNVNCLYVWLEGVYDIFHPSPHRNILRQSAFPLLFKEGFVGSTLETVSVTQFKGSKPKNWAWSFDSDARQNAGVGLVKAARDLAGYIADDSSAHMKRYNNVSHYNLSGTGTVSRYNMAGKPFNWIDGAVVDEQGAVEPTHPLYSGPIFWYHWGKGSAWYMWRRFQKQCFRTNGTEFPFVPYSGVRGHNWGDLFTPHQLLVNTRLGIERPDLPDLQVQQATYSTVYYDDWIQYTPQKSLVLGWTSEYGSWNTSATIGSKDIYTVTISDFEVTTVGSETVVVNATIVKRGVHYSLVKPADKPRYWQKLPDTEEVFSRDLNAYRGIHPDNTGSLDELSDAMGQTIDLARGKYDRILRTVIPYSTFECEIKALDSANEITSNMIEFSQGLGQLMPPFKALLTLVKGGPIERTKALADIHLYVKFGLLPAAKDFRMLKDFLKSHEAPASLNSVDENDRLYGQIDRIYQVGQYEVASKERVIIAVTPHKRELVRLHFALNSVGLAINGSNVWDLLPWSFAIDWVLPIGNVIAGLDHLVNTRLVDLNYRISSWHLSHTVNLDELFPDLNISGEISFVRYERRVSRFWSYPEAEFKGSGIPLPIALSLSVQKL